MRKELIESGSGTTKVVSYTRPNLELQALCNDLIVGCFIARPPNRTVLQFIMAFS